MQIVNTDAAPVDSFFVVASCKLQAFATAPNPRWVRSQQSVELYAVFHTLLQLILRSCIVVDSAAYQTVVSDRVSSLYFDRIRIMRGINRLCTDANFQFRMALVPSKLNAADPFIRNI